MKGFDKDCLLAIVDEKNRVVGSVAFAEYKRNPKKYRVFVIRLMVISENKDLVLSPDYFFEGGEYDTPYITLLKFREDYTDAFKRVDELLPSVEKRFVFQYYSNEGKYNANVRLYIAQQNIDELKKNHEKLSLYPSEVKKDNLIGNELLFSEIEFFEKNIIPILNLNI